MANAVKCLLQVVDGLVKRLLNMYPKKHLKFDIEQFFSTITFIKHVLLVYLQCYTWYHSTFM